MRPLRKLHRKYLLAADSSRAVDAWARALEQHIIFASGGCQRASEENAAKFNKARAS